LEEYVTSDFGDGYLNFRGRPVQGCAPYPYLFANSSRPELRLSPSRAIPSQHDSIPVAIDDRAVRRGRKARWYLGDFGTVSPLALGCLARYGPRFPNPKNAGAALTAQGAVRWNLEALIRQSGSARALCTSATILELNGTSTSQAPAPRPACATGPAGTSSCSTVRAAAKSFRLGPVYHPGQVIKAAEDAWRTIHYWIDIANHVRLVFSTTM
jgi:hypothetical protein